MQIASSEVIAAHVAGKYTIFAIVVSLIAGAVPTIANLITNNNVIGISEQISGFQDTIENKPVIAVSYDRERLMYGKTTTITREGNLDIEGIYSEGVSHFIYRINQNELRFIPTSTSKMVLRIGPSYSPNKWHTLQIVAISTDGIIGDWHFFRFEIEGENSET
jgi:hypothetical protein